MDKRVIIMRGLPGSGKSTYRRLVAAVYEMCQGYKIVVCSADDYFLSDEGYEFDPSKIGEAHNACKQNFLDALDRDYERPVVVFVDNTNTMAWEAAFYAEHALLKGWNVGIIHRKADVETCIGRQTHGVPEAVVRDMADRWEKFPEHWGTPYVVDDKSAKANEALMIDTITEHMGV